MRALALLLVLPLLAACGSGGDCPQSIGPIEQAAVMAPEKPSPPRPPAPRSAPRSNTSKSGTNGFKPVPPGFKSPTQRYYTAPTKPYRPPAIIRPQVRHTTVIHQQSSALNSPFFWMWMMQTGSIHNQQAPEGCTP